MISAIFCLNRILVVLKVCNQIVNPKLKGKVLKLEAAIRFAEDDLTAALNTVSACFALSSPNDVDTLVNMGCIRFKVILRL